MSDFKIKAIEEDFNYMFALSEAELNKLGAVKMVVDRFPGFPCRASLEDAQMDEEIMLLSYAHHQTNSPYRSLGPVFIRKDFQKPQLKTNEIPEIIKNRFLSLRCYDKSGMIVEAITCEGSDVKEKLEQFFENPVISYIHIHNAKYGCYFCVAERA